MSGLVLVLSFLVVAAGVAVTLIGSAVAFRGYERRRREELAWRRMRYAQIIAGDSEWRQWESSRG